MSLISELKRRNVIRVGAAYIVTAWLVIQVVETIFPVYGLSDAAIRYVITGLAIGLLPALILAWAFELTPEGIKRESDVDRSASITTTTGKKLDRAIMVVLAIAVGYFAFDKFVLSETREAAIAEAAREEGRSEAVIDAYGERSIAVLAFDDMSPDGDQEYMSDGIAEEILNLLAKVPDIRVISRSSAFAFKGKDLPIPEIAAQLNTAFILEGSVRKAGNEIRITAQLIEAGSDTHRWSETYDHELKNVFAIQDDIAAQVVEELKSALLGNTPKSARVNEEAYELVLQARYLWNRRAEGDEEQALELFKLAIEIDPNYAPAWTGISVAYAVAAQYGRIEKSEGMQKAREAVERALELAPEYSEAHVRLGQALAREGDAQGMLSSYQRAFELDPNNPLVLGVLAQQAGKEGRIDKVAELYDRAAVLDPLGSIWPGNKASWLVRFRRADEAEQALQRFFELNNKRRSYLEGMADIHNIRGEYEDALKVLSELPIAEFNLVRQAVALYGVGRIEESNKILEEMKTVPIKEAKMGVGLVYAARGEAELAYEWLNQAEGMSPWSIVYDAYARVLTDDPGWKPFVDSLDWPWDYEY
jgi:TolB-like protein/Tfp pilus assembly protein PilF